MVSTSDNFYFINSIKEISINDWNECVNIDHPFTRYEFLYALENSQSATTKTGWQPFHYIERNDENKIIAICPLYIKSHSFGEYIFDHSWADAYHRNGLNYYPKLQSAIPFTPVTGERIIVNKIIKNKLEKKIQIIKRIIEKTKLINVSSLHFNFLPKPDKIAKKNSELLIRKGIQFHWKNDGYKSFKEFQDSLSSRKRKVIKKERLCVIKNGLTIKKLLGKEITPKHWDFFYKCYLNTTNKKWGSTYLTKNFFLEISKTLSEKILLIIAYKDDTMIASAINFVSKTHLYGRLWGTLFKIPNLHFELCYYQAIDFAIANKINIVEAGAQGEHKLQRGYLPETTWSMHWIKNKEFSKAINQYLEQETNLVEKQKQNLEQYKPFKKN